MRVPAFFLSLGVFVKKVIQKKKLDLDRGCLLLLPPPTKHNGAVQQNTTALCNDTQQAHSHTKQQQSGAACGLITLATKTKIQSAGRHHRPVPREVGGPVATPPAQYGAGTSWSHTVQVMDRKGATVHRTFSSSHTMQAAATPAGGRLTSGRWGDETHTQRRAARRGTCVLTTPSAPWRHAQDV